MPDVPYVACAAWAVDTAEARGAIAGLLARLDLAPSAAGPGNPAAGPDGSAPGPGAAGAALPELARALGSAAERVEERLRTSAAADTSGGTAMNGVRGVPALGYFGLENVQCDRPCRVCTLQGMQTVGWEVLPQWSQHLPQSQATHCPVLPTALHQKLGALVHDPHQCGDSIIL